MKIAENVIFLENKKHFVRILPIDHISSEIESCGIVQIPEEILITN